MPAAEPAQQMVDDLREQSGFQGDAARWERLRRPVAAAVQRSGSFLDVGCANGLLLECVVAWAAEAGHVLEPFGIEIAPELARSARQRLPGEDRIAAADVRTWVPRRRYTYVRFELVYVADAERPALVEHLLTALEPHGELLVCAYRGRDGAGEQVRLDIDEELRTYGWHPQRVLHGHDADGREMTRVAVLGR